MLFNGEIYQDAEVVGISLKRWQCKDVVLNLTSEVHWDFNPDGTMTRTVTPPRKQDSDRAGRSRSGEMRDIYETVWSGDGGDAYLSDAV